MSAGATAATLAGQWPGIAALAIFGLAYVLVVAEEFTGLRKSQPVMMAAGAFGVISYLAGNFVFAQYLQVHHVPGAGEW